MNVKNEQVSNKYEQMAPKRNASWFLVLLFISHLTAIEA